jgi:hypothetical protein
MLTTLIVYSHICCYSTGGEPYLLVANRLEIRKLVLGRRQQSSHYRVLGLELRNVVSLDIHVLYQSMFWIDVAQSHIRRASVNASVNLNVVDLITTGLESPSECLISFLHN